MINRILKCSTLFLHSVVYNIDFLENLNKFCWVIKVFTFIYVELEQASSGKYGALYVQQN